MAVFALCLFAGLDAHLLWGDEAETAVKASNVLRFGVPRVDDGSNSLLVNSSDANAQRVWTWSPWLHPDPDRYQYATAVAREKFVILRRKEP